ncbi:hypothetical protein ACOKM3_14330 [Streptomyces sp. BH106]|uniref:hypothetical protein n=1 Tax=Streptomyces sp. BH106 TaxID=3410409 RepID=UPI003CF0C056
MSLPPGQLAAIRAHAQKLADDAPPLTEEAQRTIRRAFAEPRKQAAKPRPASRPAAA